MGRRNAFVGAVSVDSIEERLGAFQARYGAICGSIHRSRGSSANSGLRRLLQAGQTASVQPWPRTHTHNVESAKQPNLSFDLRNRGGRRPFKQPAKHLRQNPAPRYSAQPAALLPVSEGRQDLLDPRIEHLGSAARLENRRLAGLTRLHQRLHESAPTTLCSSAPRMPGASESGSRSDCAIQR